MSNVIQVALSVILDPTSQKVLVSRRFLNSHLGGLWEFPGGKIEHDESPEECAAREAIEEVGLAVDVISPMTIVRAKYEEITVLLHPFLCKATSLDAQARASIEVRWVTLNELSELVFPAPNAHIIAELHELISMQTG